LLDGFSTWVYVKKKKEKKKKKRKKERKKEKKKEKRKRESGTAHALKTRYNKVVD
jgi:hypothetical protein